MLTLIYTGHVWLGEPGDDSHVREVQCLATSEDGLGFVKHGPVLAAPDGIQHFRDPKVWRENGEWWLVVGAKENGLGQVRLYRSADLRAWRFDRVLAGAQAAHQGYMWECPDFFPLGNNTCCCSHRRGWRHRATATAIASRAAICSATGGLTATLG